MNAKVEDTNKFDILKWISVVIIFAAGLAANYVFADIPLSLRIIGWIVLIAALLAIAAWTAKGRVALKFLEQSRAELQRVVWPTKQETIQTTTIVVILVVTAGLFLWGVDSLLMLLVGWLTS